MKFRYILVGLCICVFIFPLAMIADDYYIQWTAIVDNGDDDCANGVAVDNSNNIIVTGYSIIDGDADYLTVKYDSNGIILWQDTLDNGVWDEAWAVAVDNSNNIIVAGLTDIGVNPDYFIVKYDSNGTILWQDTIDNGYVDYAYGVAVDNFNNIIVTGASCISGNLYDYDYFTVKYDSNGVILWQDTLDISWDNHEAWAVAVDNSNNIIVTGFAEVGLDTVDYLTIKYDPSGEILWQETLDNGRWDRAYGVAVDNSNNIIVTGGCSDDISDYFTVKYDSNGTILWQDALDIGEPSVAFGVAVDNSNNIIVTGGCTIFSYCSYYLTVKYDSNGAILWQDTLLNGTNDCAFGVAVDNSNNIIVTGDCKIGDDFDYCTVKYVPLTGISDDDGSHIMNNPVLYDIYPTPTTDEKWIIRYSLPYASDVKINIYNGMGALVHVLENTEREAGYYTVYWNGHDKSGRKVPNGIYFLKFKAKDFTSTKKILLIR